LEAAGWWQPYPKLDPILLPGGLLKSVHSPDYLELLPTICRYGERVDADTYTCRGSWKLALNSAGGAAAVAGAVWDGQAQRGFALTRPPGHHAGFRTGMGFCLLNNIAIAAQHLIADHGAKRLAVVDLDLHHGNGTQAIFYRRSDVLFFSTHQVPLYPGTGNLEETGEDQGQGYTINLPLPPGSGDRAFLTAMETVILPLLDRYGPEMILVSYGFDPHWKDPLGHLRLSADCYGRLIQMLAEWADRRAKGRLAVFLEGGYDLEAAAACSQALAAALLDEVFVDSIGPSPRPEGHSWEGIIETARQIWGI
jgi:acetoin utilization deacetylase AcuC-like enzyme